MKHTNLIIYHSADWDGWMSAAIALDALRGDADTVGWKYGQPDPDTSGYRNIYVLDVCLSREAMTSVDPGSMLIWNDHHVSSIREMGDIGCLGLRSPEYAACQLTWQWFHGKARMPLAVQLLGEYDIFRKDERLHPWSKILDYQMGLRNRPGSVEAAVSILKNSRRYPGFNERIRRTIASGHEFLAYKRNEALMAWNCFSFDITADGRRGKFLMTHDKSSLMSEPLFELHEEKEDLDFVMLANTDGTSRQAGMYNISIRVPSWSDFNAEQFAKRYDGGGHLRAAGCRFPFEVVDAMMKTGVL